MQASYLRLPDGKTGVWVSVPIPLIDARAASLINLITELAFGRLVLLGVKDGYLVMGYTTFHCREKAKQALQRTYAQLA